MTTLRSTLTIAAALGAGIGFGAGIASLNATRAAQADSIPKTESDAIYRELDTASSSLAESSNVLAKISKVVMPAVVHIQSIRRVASRGRIEETGSGVIINSPKRSGNYVVTNRHVIFDALPKLDQIAIHLHDGRVLNPKRVWEDPYSDVAVMEIEATGVDSVRWGDSDKLQIGNIVLASGSPFGLSQSVTMGIISARGRSSFGIGNKSSVINQDFLQTDAAINPGNSGGPLINLKGQLVGINTAIASTHGGNEGIGFSIPSNLVHHVTDHLLEYGEVKRAYLGVKLDSDFDFETAKALDLFRVSGARVLEVYPNTPAARARIQYNDVVLEFDGHEVRDESHLINLVSLSPVGKTVSIVVWREGTKKTITMDLIPRPDAE